MRLLTRAGACALLAAALAGCGGGGGGGVPAEQTVRAAHFRFAAPADWKTTRTAHSVSLGPKASPAELVSVSVFPLIRAYTPALFPKVVGELDRTAATLAADLGGKVERGETVQVAGIRSRQYVLAYSRDGSDLRQRLTFVLRGKTEFQLLCRWAASGSEPEACARLTESFRLRG
ncbi:MAG TPA: hypothetical protein VFA44_01705 [Gaiellaceae bacterium]|nr:hypothetical protein [Gaiellaceae bacterium]